MLTAILIWLGWNIVNSLIFHFYRNVDMINSRSGHSGEWGVGIELMYFRERLIVAILLSIIPIIFSLVVHQMHKDQKDDVDDIISDYKINKWTLLFGTSKQIMKINQRRNFDRDLLRQYS
jgi:hypothetical protein